MKKIILLFLLFISIFIYTNPAQAEFVVPQQKGYVNDYAKVLSPSALIKLDKIISDLKSKTGAEIFIVMLKSIDNSSINDVGYAIANSWKIYHGIIIVASINDGRINIFTTGDLDKYLSNSQMQEILTNYMTPYINVKKYDDGIIYSTYAAADTIANGYGVKLSENIKLPAGEVSKSLTFKEKVKLIPSVIIIMLIIAIIIQIKDWIMKKMGFKYY